MYLMKVCRNKSHWSAVQSAEIDLAVLVYASPINSLLFFRAGSEGRADAHEVQERCTKSSFNQNEGYRVSVGKGS